MDYATHTESREQYLSELKGSGIECPADIVRFLDKYVIGQEDAKKAAAMMLWNHLHGLKTNTLFIGPSGCGKTHIWRTLRKIPVLEYIIHITDASDITQKGWKGDKKSDSIIGDIFYNKFLGVPDMKSFLETSIIIFDEFDKLLAPEYSSGGDNVSYHVQAQFLALIEGTDITIKNPNPDSFPVADNTEMINTSDISFGFCGAFEELYNKRKADEHSKTFGFGESSNKSVEKITIDDVIKFGARPELAGRIQNISVLNPLTVTQIRDILRRPETSPVSKYVNTYGMTVNMSDKYAEKLAATALESPMGIRMLNSYIAEDMNNIIFDTRVDEYEKLTVSLDLDKNGNKFASGNLIKSRKRRTLEPEN